MAKELILVASDTCYYSILEMPGIEYYSYYTSDRFRYNFINLDNLLKKLDSQDLHMEINGDLFGKLDDIATKQGYDTLIYESKGYSQGDLINFFGLIDKDKDIEHIKKNLDHHFWDTSVDLYIYEDEERCRNGLEGCEFLSSLGYINDMDNEEIIEYIKEIMAEAKFSKEEVNTTIIRSNLKEENIHY